MDFKSDRGLQARMGIVMIAFAILYLAFIGVVSLAIGIVPAAIIVTITVASQYLFGDKISLKLTRAKRVSPDENPELHNTVNKIARQAGLPKPDLAISNSAAPNAFVTGRSKGSATMCITKGLLRELEQDELESVIAHEFSHVKNRDMVIMTTISSLMAVAHFFVRWGWLMDDDNGGIFAVVIASLIVMGVSFFIVRLLSRYREYAADRGAAAITGNPTALASAIKKISTRTNRIPDEDLRKVSDTNAMNFYGVDATFSDSIMSTHPNPEDRIEKLKDIQSQMQE
jgi:heat shock protein HtpX